jgi:GrpB-like predicted nucleotidyltransferase (UPF0157 family)
VSAERSLESDSPRDEAIALVPHDSTWAAKFEQERGRLEDAIGSWAEGGFHHVGGTQRRSGARRQAIVDILVGVRDLDSSRECLPRLGELGYLYAP